MLVEDDYIRCPLTWRHWLGALAAAAVFVLVSSIPVWLVP